MGWTPDTRAAALAIAWDGERQSAGCLRAVGGDLDEAACLAHRVDQVLDGEDLAGAISAIVHIVHHCTGANAKLVTTDDNGQEITP